MHKQPLSTDIGSAVASNHAPRHKQMPQTTADTWLAPPQHSKQHEAGYWAGAGLGWLTAASLVS